MLALWLLVSCAQDCEAPPLPDLLLVRTEASDWSAGEYMLELEDEETFETRSCTVSLPGESVACDDGISQAAVTDGQIEQLALWGFTPDQLRVQVSLDGEVLFLASLSPEYALSPPIEEGCSDLRAGAVDISW